MNVPRVKICGLRTAEHALAAADAGADCLGFVFVEGVRRQLQPDLARRLVSAYRAARGPGGPALVGLFRNQPPAWVNDVIRDLGLDFAQLCGDEGPDYAARLAVPAIRQVLVRPDTGPDELRSRVCGVLETHAMVVLDRFDPHSPGGGGKAFDWRAATGVAPVPGVLLAGGLTPDNVAGAVRLLRPWGLDVSTGVETDGVKDPEKIRAFIAAARGQMPGTPRGDARLP
ncbi:MAG: phosphoribosylanthranilate isomerase [Gemmatimonadetes bacterium]|nr:phosphoribosylanthranilate isomerase [Gemmatimonadota bacterium]